MEQDNTARRRLAAWSRLAVGMLALLSTGVWMLAGIPAASAAGTAGWTPWQKLGGTVAGGMDAASRGNGRVDVFGRGANNLLYQWIRDGGAWSEPARVGAPLVIDSDPAVAAMNGNTLHVFVHPKNVNNVAYLTWEAGSGWSGWTYPPAPPPGVQLTGSPDVASWGTGRLDVVIRDSGQRLWHLAYATGEGWGDWEDTGGRTAADPSAVSWATGRLDIFATGLNGDLYQRTYEHGWSDWHSLSGNLVGGPDVAAIPGRRTLYAFARVQAAGTPLFVLPYTYPGWDRWSALDGGPTSDPAAAGSPDGTVTLLTRGANGVPYARSRPPANPPVQPSPLRSRIVDIATGELGYTASASGCQKYASMCADWCAMFTDWVWSHAGVRSVPDTFVARGVGAWGVQHGLFKTRPAGSRGGNPLPGDIAVYGPPDGQVGGHVAVVEAVQSDGTVTLINGNFDNQVRRTEVDPLTSRAGSENVLISGYVSVPGA